MSHIDSDILENVNTLVEVAETLLEWVKLASETKDRSEGSMEEIGMTAHDALIYFRNMIEVWLDED